MASELKPWIGDPPRTEPPVVQGYYLFRRETLDIAKASLIGLAMIPVWITLFVGLLYILSGRSSVGGTFSILNVVIIIATIAATTVAHELLHGLSAWLFGARPAFGTGSGFVYTTHFEPMTRFQFLTILVTPGIVIGAGGIVLALAWPEIAGWMLLASTFNASGVGGDIWMVFRTVQAPPGSIFFDLADGFAILAPDQINSQLRAPVQ